MDLSLYRAVRAATERLCEPLAVEDMVVQTMPDVSPTKWHLAHTSWFFEEFVLAKLAGYRRFDERYQYLFNSYYEAVGERHPRPERGHLSRPTVAEIRAYRRHVDEQMERNWERVPGDVVELGINHEEQHQELLLTDVKHVLATNPLRPAYRTRAHRPVDAAQVRWLTFPGGLADVGDRGDAFAFDNERPRHRVLLRPFELQSRLVTTGEWLAFMQDRGYERAELWLSDGWDALHRFGWRAPLYWDDLEGAWHITTLSGRRGVDPAEPVCHVSHYEADAFARWAGARLPLETEWELAASSAPVTGNFVESGELHPRPGTPQWFGDAWEWTASAYLAWPGYAPAPGALGEYNGKFMSNRMVLRGGSCVSPLRHLRATYRNFFPPETRWQFSGVRLAR